MHCNTSTLCQLDVVEWDHKDWLFQDLILVQWHRDCLLLISLTLPKSKDITVISSHPAPQAVVWGAGPLRVMCRGPNNLSWCHWSGLCLQHVYLLETLSLDNLHLLRPKLTHAWNQTACQILTSLWLKLVKVLWSHSIGVILFYFEPSYPWRSINYAF